MPENITLRQSQSILKISLREKITIHAPPEDLLDSIVKANTFDNPKYASNLEHDYSNWKVPPTIETYRFAKGDLILPLGFGSQLLQLCKEHSLEPSIEDSRIVCPVSFPKALKGIALRSYQERAVTAALKSPQGVICSPTGSGKSLLGLEIIRRRQQKTLILLHRGDLAKQWIGVIKERLGLTAGFIGDGSWEIGQEITIGMAQTLASREEEAKKLSDVFGAILVDEVHHVPADTFFETIGWFKAKYRYGLSATLERRDGLMPMIFLAIGPVIATIEKREVEGVGATVKATICPIDTGFKPGLLNSWAEFLDSICTSSERNNLIIKLATQSSEPVLVLCDRIAHACDLSGMLARRNIDHVLAHGKLSKDERKVAMERIKTAQITVGTSGLCGEGIDVSAWTVLILAAPISSETKLLQAIGRVVRSCKGKKGALIYDLKDDCGFSGASFNKRLQIYRKHGIFVDFNK